MNGIQDCPKLEFAQDASPPILIKKKCSKCKKEKPIDKFDKQKGGKFGVRSWCNSCRRMDNKKNKKKRSIQGKVYYKINRNKIIASAAIYRKANKEKILLYNKKYYRKNIDAIKIYRKRYAENHKPERNFYLTKRRLDIKIRLNEGLSSAISRSVKGVKNGRHWEEIVGYTLGLLMKHLERQFVNGMAWENYGKWHIEHKIPISVHNFTKPEHEDFKRCWALKNLQPMWAEENFKKGTRLIKSFQPSLLL